MTSTGLKQPETDPIIKCCMQWGIDYAKTRHGQSAIKNIDFVDNVVTYMIYHDEKCLEIKLKFTTDHIIVSHRDFARNSAGAFWGCTYPDPDCFDKLTDYLTGIHNYFKHGTWDDTPPARPTKQ